MLTSLLYEWFRIEIQGKSPLKHAALKLLQTIRLILLRAEYLIRISHTLLINCFQSLEKLNAKFLTSKFKCSLEKSKHISMLRQLLRNCVLR